MECDEEEDANSLLSLSQTFLQPDSSSSSISLSANQLHNWSALTSTSADVAGQFSPISPADDYSTNNTGHTLTDNDANFRFYGARPATNQSAGRNNVSSLFNRSGNCNVSVSISNSFLPASRPGNDFSTGQMAIDTSTSSCYEQASTPRATGNLYGDKDSSYSNRNGLNNSTGSHHTDASNTLAANFSQSSYSDDHSMLSLASTSDPDGKLGIRNVQLDQKMFDSRSKQDYNKDLTNLYDQSTDKPLQSTEITMSFDRRDGNNFDNTFEFPSGSRDFTPSARLDVPPITRGTQEQEYHQSQKYSSTQLRDSNVLSCSVPLDSKRAPTSYINFGLGGHIEDGYGRLNNPQKKSSTSFNPPLNDDLATELEPVFSHGYHTDFGGHQKYLLDSHRSFGTNDFQDGEDAGRFNMKDQTNSREVNSKWSGRPRAHRKMARLLGSKDHRDYTQDVDTNNSHKNSFSKSLSLEHDAQNKNSYQQNMQRDLAANSRAFLTMEEELDLRTNHHQQRNFASRRDESLENQSVQRELGLLQTASTFSFDSNTIASALHKDTASSILASQQFLPSAQLDLDFHSSLSMPQPQKDLDLNQHFGLQVSKDFGLESSHSASNHDDLTFDHTGSTQHVNQTELSLPDSLGIVPQAPELSFEAYLNSASDRDFNSTSDRDFNSTSERDLTFCRKFSTTRDLNYVPNTTVNDFNIEDYMNAQTGRDLSQTYFNRPDLPQDMTIYQKTSIDKTPLSETLTQFKGREKGQGLTGTKDKQGEISELQKELTKTSTKESMKGIRIPRDINRAMEILQGLQEDEREEERRKEQQQRQQQLQGLMSNPKKSFQNKHNIDNLSLSDQQFLGSSGNFMEDQSVSNFLDHSHLMMSEQTQDNQQIMQSYQAFPQSVDVDMTSTLTGKRDLPQNLAHNMAPELDYHFLKKLACSASIKSTTVSQGSSFSTNTPNLVSILADNVPHDSGIQFSMSGIHFQPQSELEDMSNNVLNNGSQSTLELNRPKNEMTFMDFESQPAQHIIIDKPQTCSVSDSVLHPSSEMPHVVNSKLEADVLNMSRKNLYDMMKREQFCDAVLSVSKQTVKVHQVVLCSMSQYLTTLLQKMKLPLQSYAAKNSSSPSLSFTSQTTRNNSVLLIVNCDGIKSSSMMTFLLYLYLGRAEINESNVLDIYILACSLRVPTLKDLCKEFMWQAHIPNEQIKVPQLVVSSQRLETQEVATMTEIGMEDKSTNTSRWVKGAEVATQTDRSTSEAGGGGQEEWVMLKKTKQKTVSPSKSRLIGKSLTGLDSPISCKTGKKGWLSPIRRYKTENQIEDKNSEKEVAVSVKEILDVLPVTSSSESKSQHSRASTVEKETSGTLYKILKQNTESQVIKSYEKQISLNKQVQTPKKNTRTTVEIAAAAAAAKLASHSYGTRTARGVVKLPVSYASLASGLEKKKPVANPKEKTALTMSKKKDFIKSNSQTDFSSQAETSSFSKSNSFAIMLKDNLGTDNNSSQNESNSAKPGLFTTETLPGSTAVAPSEQIRADVDVFKSSVKQPFKKSIVHRSRSEEVLNKNYLVASQPSKVDVTAGNDNDFMDSYLIDSIVNTIECDNAEVDFQKVINDLDTLSKSPLLTTTSTSISSTSLTSPLKSPAVLLSTPDSTSPPKSRTTPQGFRKRLIHQINAEKNGPSSPKNNPSKNNLPAIISISQENISTIPASGSSDDPASASLAEVLSSASVSLATSVALSTAETCQNTCTVDQLTISYKNVPHATSESDKDQLPTDLTETVDELALTLYSLGEDTDLMLDGKTNSFSSMTDIDLGLKDDPDSQFLHKIFKRKKRSKARKSVVADTEGTAARSKVKKIISDTEGIVTKQKLRKATGSDTEGGTRGSKVKKNVFSENEGALAKVRPPPKKRAKMELALLKAGDSEKHGVSRGDNLKSEAEELCDESKKDTVSNCKSKTHSSLDGLKEDLKLDGQKSDVVKSQKSTKRQENITHLTDSEVTMETKLARLLAEMTKTMDPKTRHFTCKLCQMKLKSALRTVKHLRTHGLTPEDALQNIIIGEILSPEVCDICGYRTKDLSFHYMHIHKYFKHAVPLPLGWSTDKCEVCGKECFSKFQLKEHMMSHDDSHYYVCWHCGQSFKMRNNLNSHIFHKHSNVRKHQCKACGKAFKTWTHLKVHVRSHTGERPFACVECNHRSTTQGNMKLHLATHGYSKAKIEELMEKIHRNTPEMDPKSLDQIMINIAEKMKAEQQAGKEKKCKRKKCKKNSDSEDQKNADLISPKSAKDIPPEGTAGIKKTKKKPTEHKTTSTSKFEGSRIKQLLTQPMSKMESPECLFNHLTQTSMFNSGKNYGGKEENLHLQVVSDSTDSNISTLRQLLQQQTQKQETSGLSGTVFFIQLPQTDQRQPQQRHQHHNVGSLSSMMGYTVIPSQVLPGQTGTDSSVDPAISLSVPVFSASDVLTSGLGVLQSGVHAVQLVQADGVYAASGISSETSQGQEILQNNTDTSLPLPDSKILVTDSSGQELNTDTFHAILSANSTSNGSTAVMVLPSVSSISAHEQSMQQQVQTIFSYPPLIPSSQSMLLPVVTPSVQILPPNLDTSNFANFSVAVPSSEEVVTLNMSQESFEDVTTEEKILVETQEEVGMPAMSVVIGNSNSNSGLVTYTVVTCDDAIHTKEENKIVDGSEVSVCKESVSTFG